MFNMMGQERGWIDESGQVLIAKKKFIYNPRKS